MSAHVILNFIKQVKKVIKYEAGQEFYQLLLHVE